MKTPKLYSFKSKVSADYCTMYSFSHPVFSLNALAPNKFARYPLRATGLATFLDSLLLVSKVLLVSTSERTIARDPPSEAADSVAAYSCLDIMLNDRSVGSGGVELEECLMR
eukprot:TRINITY_DN750_c0_g1_i2.p2 TRINITY_DN750_c0_g1~~TRINITY_DN750_c0_g1_i2.p2  ORF type:complete len:112 (+),score=15.79 TRINITY_DN750_c0_g1_i2:129-464(+)